MQHAFREILSYFTTIGLQYFILLNLPYLQHICSNVRKKRQNKNIQNLNFIMCILFKKVSLVQILY